MIGEKLEWIRLIVSWGGTIHDDVEEKHQIQIGRWPKEHFYIFFETTAGRQRKKIKKIIKKIIWNLKDGNFICKIEKGKLLGYNEKVWPKVFNKFFFPNLRLKPL